MTIDKLNKFKNVVYQYNDEDDTFIIRGLQLNNLNDKITEIIDYLSTFSPTFRYWDDGTIYYRQGIRDGYIVIDKYKTGGSLTLFNAGAGVLDTDYELIDKKS